MKGLIYKITCQPTQRSYIDKTRSAQQQRWYQHCSDARRGSDKDLHQAICEYGTDAFQVIHSPHAVSSKSGQRMPVWTVSSLGIRSGLVLLSRSHKPA